MLEYLARDRDRDMLLVAVPQSFNDKGTKKGPQAIFIHSTKYQYLTVAKQQGYIVTVMRSKGYHCLA
jgi:hypothetical protein